MQLKQFVIVVIGLALASFGLLFVMPGMEGIERLPHDPRRPTEVLGQGTPAGPADPTSGSSDRTRSPSTTVGPDDEEVMTMGNLGVSVGHVLGLWPGRAVPLPVTFTNAQSFPVMVVSTTTEVTSASGSGETAGSPGPACTAGDLDVPGGTVALADPVTLAPHASAATSVPVRLARDASDACKGASFTVSVTAAGEQQ